MEAWFQAAHAPGRPSGTLVAVHGIARDALEQAVAWGDFARTHGLALVAPRFPHATHPAYQRLGSGPGPGKDRSDEVLVRLLAWLETEGCAVPRPWYFFGHSGGAQFAHRFALFHPSSVDGLLLSSAGWYTLPDNSSPFPHGLGAGFRRVSAGQLRAFLSIPTLVTVGALDVERDRSLRRDPRLDDVQGRDRVARARSWVQAMRRSAMTWGCSSSRIALAELPGAGHAFRDCLASGLHEVTARFLDELSAPSGRSRAPRPAAVDAAPR